MASTSRDDTVTYLAWNADLSWFNVMPPQSVLEDSATKITSLSDKPNSAKGADVTVLAGSGEARFEHWATAILPGPANEARQRVSFLVTNIVKRFDKTRNRADGSILNTIPFPWKQP
jgi:hypothetical protein